MLFHERPVSPFWSQFDWPLKRVHQCKQHWLLNAIAATLRCERQQANNAGLQVTSIAASKLLKLMATGSHAWVGLTSQLQRLVPTLPWCVFVFHDVRNLQIWINNIMHVCAMINVVSIVGVAAVFKGQEGHQFSTIDRMHLLGHAMMQEAASTSNMSWLAAHESKPQQSVFIVLLWFWRSSNSKKLTKKWLWLTPMITWTEIAGKRCWFSSVWTSALQNLVHLFVRLLATS